MNFDFDFWCPWERLVSFWLLDSLALRNEIVYGSYVIARNPLAWHIYLHCCTPTIVFCRTKAVLTIWWLLFWTITKGHLGRLDVSHLLEQSQGTENCWMYLICLNNLRGLKISLQIWLYFLTYWEDSYVSIQDIIGPQSIYFRTGSGVHQRVKSHLEACHQTWQPYLASQTSWAA